ncbi:cell cycle checkpoint control protein RAD9A isoform X1 [Malaclemys terrapin pileata]|uniref:cell cycle checkpoint control protein RAD9A isoform X1 n=2 Tax=Malaclemys terrapin pileata TaxID=2991368 RepID=UPI0023A85B96|nr:cell cycle checkpoint control protein RAD9A isoform X1 [Malaclemys terrapin pileata]XP_053881707.1 cell cycle checkpoint control protein RAD9A isoform X1 [Malaclemys terrapin pileata]XP_053881708.1 cell cycle checkpoint control protein RAD9A isoform X1 [Malaclemys terrapin pileata]
MRCLVTGGNVKVLGKAVHSLSRIGDELYVDPTEDGLSLRAVNSSRSAYACFLFAPLFFQLYEEGSPDPDGEPFRCKVFMKSFLGVFRSLPSLEKMVEKCLISLNPRASRLVVQLHCKYGVTKTHNLSFQECELLQAVFDKELCANTLRAPARVLVDAVVHFPVTLAEVTLGVSPAGKVSFRNYLDEETEPSRTMVTELCLSEDEFQDVQVQQQSHVTFCLKEFRGLLSFAESSNLPLNIHFDSPGRPAIFTLSDPLLEVHLVLATLSDPNSSSQVCSTTLQARPANGAFPMATPDDDFMGDDIDSYMIAMETTCEEGPGLPSSPTFPQRRPHPGAALESESSTMESDLEGAVPGTPPQKKFRSLFFGSVLTQSQVGTHPGPSQDVLAEDSEGES